MAVFADCPSVATRVSLYLHEVHASAKQSSRVVLDAHAYVSCPTHVGRGAQHEVSVPLRDQAHSPFRRAQVLILHTMQRHNRSSMVKGSRAQ